MSNGIVQIDSAAGKIWEISPSTLNVLGLQVPVVGGGYFRLFPYAASKTFLQRLEKQGAKLVMYLHPWEIDPEQPRMGGPWVSQFRHYLNLHKTQDRLCSLLNNFRFNTRFKRSWSQLLAYFPTVIRQHLIVKRILQWRNACFL